MHRYRIVTQISLIFSILNLVLAAPIVVQEKHEARGDEMVVAEDVPVAVMPKKRSKLEEAPEGSTSLPPSSLDAMASPQHSSLSDGSTSSGYPTPHLSSASSVSGYSWLLDRLPRPSLSPNLPASLYESTFPHSPSSSEIQLPEGLQELAPEMPPSPHLPESPYTSSSSYQASLPSWQGSPHPPSSGYQGSGYRSQRRGKNLLLTPQAQGIRDR
ncbi:hypothetical protein BGY98DRAFT_715927 [Russula aff. rugulosa BPL654]|nr:hypothetical protein BGY98DRAFT_715927 [Russula aff. rugulosa BPL654]